MDPGQSHLPWFLLREQCGRFDRKSARLAFEIAQVSCQYSGEGFVLQTLFPRKERPELSLDGTAGRFWKEKAWMLCE